MKIDPVRSPGATHGARRTGEIARFEPAASPSSTRAAAVSGASPAPGIDALLALQGAGPDARSRQARRGRRTLDTLERLARALLEGVAPSSLRAELAAAQSAAEPTGDPGLDAVLREIDTRAAVELAKLDYLAASA